MRCSYFNFFSCAIALLAITRTVYASTLCNALCTGTGQSRACTYVFALDLYASETGYYTVQGCSGIQPTLTMEENVEYTFIQRDSSNWMHPLGFGYFPDGAHRDAAELEPGINPNDPTCIASQTCQHPMYYGGAEGTTFLGSAVPDDFGLDVYEETFIRSRPTWMGFNETFNVKLKITDSVTTDIFYFCHIHNGMSGRIKILKSNGNPRSSVNYPGLGYAYATVSAPDSACGTHGVEPFFDTDAQCPDMTFMCNVNEQAGALKQFGECMVAIDCAMHVGMRVNIHENPTATFMHQMIPHHINAVNMAKIMLKLGSIKEPEIEDLMWDIIGTQNAQITTMRKWLVDNGYQEFDSCPHKTKESSELEDIKGVQDSMMGVNVASLAILCAVAVTAPVALYFINLNIFHGVSNVDTPHEPCSLQDDQIEAIHGTDNKL